MLRSALPRSQWLSAALRAVSAPAIAAPGRSFGDAFPENPRQMPDLRPAGAGQAPELFRGFSSSAVKVDGNSGPKAILKDVLSSKGPLNSDEIWSIVSQDSETSPLIKSKRLMKKMLLHMKKEQLVETLIPATAIEAGWSVEPAKAPPGVGKKGKKSKSKGQKFKFVYLLKGMEVPKRTGEVDADGSSSSSTDEAEGEGGTAAQSQNTTAAAP